MKGVCAGVAALVVCLCVGCGRNSAKAIALPDAFEVAGRLYWSGMESMVTLDWRGVDLVGMHYESPAALQGLYTTLSPEGLTTGLGEQSVRRNLSEVSEKSAFILLYQAYSTLVKQNCTFEKSQNGWKYEGYIPEYGYFTVESMDGIGVSKISFLEPALDFVPLTFTDTAKNNG